MRRTNDLRLQPPVPASGPVPLFLHPHAAQTHVASLSGNTILAYPDALFVSARPDAPAAQREVQTTPPNTPLSCPKSGHPMRGHTAQTLLKDKCDTAIAIMNTKSVALGEGRMDGRLLLDDDDLGNYKVFFQQVFIFLTSSRVSPTARRVP